jgi:hypothetical protein
MSTGKEKPSKELSEAQTEARGNAIKGTFIRRIQKTTLSNIKAF